jgi:UDP-N-acetylglucosamine 2-epimerase (non-hydrolysing)
MKLAVVVGTRPEIVKMAPIIRSAQAHDVPLVVLHTGQHYSFEMDGVFFEQLELPPPTHNLRVGSGTHGYQISSIIAALEAVLKAERPDAVLVEGDTNSVLAAGLIANKLGLRVGHVEAGLRSYDRTMPEEVNRVLVDHLADDLFAPTDHARDILLGEAVPASRIHVTGNTVVDEVLFQRTRVNPDQTLAALGAAPAEYAVATVHRAENVGDPERLRGIFSGLEQVAQVERLPVLVALHPRTTQRLTELGIVITPAVRLLPPLGYHEFLALQAHAALMLTDSGGVQEEACILGVPCVTLRDNTERPESITVGANRLVGATPDRIVAGAVAMLRSPRGWINPFGDGHAGDRIVGLLVDGAQAAVEPPRVTVPVIPQAAVENQPAAAAASSRSPDGPPAGFVTDSGRPTGT